MAKTFESNNNGYRHAVLSRVHEEGKVSNCPITPYNSLLHVCVEYSSSFQANSKIYYLPSFHIALSMASLLTIIILGEADVQKIAHAGGQSFLPSV